MHQNKKYRSTSGSIFAMLFGAVAIVGVIGVSANTLIRGPMSSMAEVTRRTIAENSMIANARLAIMMAGTQAGDGDCDADQYIEPIPYRNAGALPKPTGGGYLPTTIGSSLNDPWGTEYGYCVWDHGPLTTINNVAACGGSGALRLRGTNAKTQTTIAIISAGKDRIFQTTCNAFVDANADGNPDTPLVNKPAGGNDIVIAHTYAEVMAIGGDGLWRKKNATTADIDKDVEVRSSSDAVTARIERETGFGIFNSIYVDNIYRRNAARITVADETMFNGNVGLGMIPGHRLDVSGHTRILSTSPTLYMQDTDHRSSAIHTNSNTFYILNAPVNSTAWAQNGSYWPLTIDLATDATTLGGDLYIRDGGWVRTHGSTGWLNGDYGGGWYMEDTTWIRAAGNKGIFSPNEFQGTLFRDANDNGYYVDPNGISILNDIRPQIIYDLNNAGYYIDMNNTSYVNQFTGNRADFDIYYDRNDANYYADPHYISYMNQIRARFIYDLDNTGYYLDPSGTSIIEALQAGIMYDRYNTGYYVQPRSVSIMEDVRVGVLYDRYNTGYYWQGRATSSANVMYAYAYYYHSDARKKKNIVTITPEEVNKLYKLRGVNFDWKESGKHDIGLIAQEVQEVFPELVSQLKEGELGVQYGNFIPLLIEAAKAQKTEITALRETVDSQEQRLKSLESFMKDTIEEKRKQAATRAAFEKQLKENPPKPPAPPPAVTPPTAPPVTTAAPVPAPQPTGLVSQPQVDISDVPVVSDISICPKATAPACVSKEALSNAEEFTCRTEMGAYIFSAKLYNLCVRADKEAAKTFRIEYDDVIKKSIAKRFDLGDTTLETIAYTHVIALNGLISGVNIQTQAAPNMVPPPPITEAPIPAPIPDQKMPSPLPVAQESTPPVKTKPPIVKEAPAQQDEKIASSKEALSASKLPAEDTGNAVLEDDILKWLPLAGLAGALFVLLLFLKYRGRKE